LLPVALGGVHGILGVSGVCCNKSMVRSASGVLFGVVDDVFASEMVEEEEKEGKKKKNYI
jgi:hypothetical protein